jgi:hypothetical protein
MHSISIFIDVLMFGWGAGGLYMTLFSNRGKTSGRRAFFACAGSTRYDSLRMCSNHPSFPS